MKKYFRFTETKILLCSLHPAPIEEGRSRTSRTRGGDAVDADALTDERRNRGRRSRVVPTPRRWRQVLPRLQRPVQGDGGNQALAHRGERGVSRSTIAQGRPECSPPPPVVFALLAQLFRARAHGCRRAPGLPCALSFERAGIRTRLGRDCAARTYHCVLGCLTCKSVRVVSTDANPSGLSHGRRLDSTR
jgi:hypothetical protein